MAPDRFDNDLAAAVWRNKYRYRRRENGVSETRIADTWDRVAAAVASVEPTEQSRWRDRFRDAVDGFGFLPAGRILAGAGTAYKKTLYNCFVMDFIDDSLQGIFESLQQSAMTMQAGGGIGCDFSSLRPRGASAAGVGTVASGPVSFMQLWNAMCETLLSTGTRRGAMMATLRCDHPDIQEFIDAKRQSGKLTNFNLSVQITDEFLEAVDNDGEWPLVFPADQREASGDKSIRWPGHDAPVGCVVHRRVSAVDLWRQLIDAAFESAEPGILLVDRINRRNNLGYCEHITTTNPCGEIPLPPNGACNLGSINLAVCVDAPFTKRARLDMRRIAKLARSATRFLDNVITLSPFPLPAQAAAGAGSRRIGLGITGLADALIMLGQHYDSDAGRQTAVQALTTIRDVAYETSVELAAEKGPFPYFERDQYLAGAYVQELPDTIRDRIARDGIRNSHLLAIAPAGSISVLANNVSSGIEPAYAADMERWALDRDGRRESFLVGDYAVSVWRRQAKSSMALPEAFVSALELPAVAHLQMVASLQVLVDNSISKTVNVPADITRDAFSDIYRQAIELGLNGCTVYRSNPVTGAVLAPSMLPGQAHCCSPDREGD